jgi:hypothetical protein
MHEHDTPLALNHQGIQPERDHHTPEYLEHIFRPPLAHLDRHRRDATANDEAPAPGGALHAPHAHLDTGAIADDADVGHAGAPARASGVFETVGQLTGVLDDFLGRYAHQIETLALIELPRHSTSIIALPSGFWAQFSALRLFGVKALTLRRHWSGWTVVPPTTHPLRYLVCWDTPLAERTIIRVRLKWTWHGGVRLVVGQNATDTYHVVKDVGDDQWITKMEETYGILPEL